MPLSLQRPKRASSAVVQRFVPGAREASERVSESVHDPYLTYCKSDARFEALICLSSILHALLRRRPDSQTGSQGNKASCETAEEGEQGRPVPIDDLGRLSGHNTAAKGVVFGPTTPVDAHACASVHRSDQEETAYDKSVAASQVLPGGYAAAAGGQRRKCGARQLGEPQAHQTDGGHEDLQVRGSARLTARQDLRFARLREAGAAAHKSAMATLIRMRAALSKPCSREKRSGGKCHGHGVWECRLRVPRTHSVASHAPPANPYVCPQHGQAGAHRLAGGLRGAHEGRSPQASARLTLENDGEPAPLPGGQVVGAGANTRDGLALRVDATEGRASSCGSCGCGVDFAGLRDADAVAAHEFASGLLTSPPPSAPASPLDLHVDEEDEAPPLLENGGELARADEPTVDSTRRLRRVGVRLRNVRALSFGEAPSTPPRPTQPVAQQRSRPGDSRKSKRTKLEMAEATIEALREQLTRQNQPARKPAEPIACARCQALTEGHHHSEALHKRQHTYVKRQLDESKEKMLVMITEHEEALVALQAAHEKDCALKENKHHKKVTSLEYKLDLAKIDNNKFTKAAHGTATAAAIAAREAAKELAKANQLNAQLTATAARDKSDILNLKDDIAELKKTLQEIQDELPDDDDNDEVEAEEEAEHSDSEPGADDPGQGSVEEKACAARVSIVICSVLSRTTVLTCLPSHSSVCKACHTRRQGGLAMARCMDQAGSPPQGSRPHRREVAAVARVQGQVRRHHHHGRVELEQEMLAPHHCCTCRP